MGLSCVTCSEGGCFGVCATEGGQAPGGWVRGLWGGGGEGKPARLLGVPEGECRRLGPQGMDDDGLCVNFFLV